jgi:hypothetical protein
MHLFSSDPLVLCRRPTAVPPCHKEAATTRLLPGKNDALPSDDGHDTAVVACRRLIGAAAPGENYLAQIEENYSAVDSRCGRHLPAPPGGR